MRPRLRSRQFSSDLPVSPARRRRRAKSSPSRLFGRHHRRAHRQRALYYVIDQGHALRYPVGVGRLGKQWSGTAYINGKYVNPSWSPPAEVRRDKPSLPAVIPGGSPHNPMGVAAMTLSGGEYAIHGTNQPGSIGGYVSYGCIRMYNQDITDLFARVSYGTTVVVMQ